jgi:lipopolysaccharide transport system ATP-binding protein
MADRAIVVDHLSKRYRIGVRERHDTLRDRLVAAATEPWRRLRRFGRSSNRNEDAIWALRDVSFEVAPGEVVGIIGRNGGGKSTLLKILTRITEPTGGRAELHGRVGSLLEVGTGFHPELTGRENIFLSGAILGMARPEIKAQFDEIVDFSGVEKFIDTPVKRYSSGMHVRLGFAIAAHLQPEVLLVDEVLAVGDAEFQKKCLGKMGDVAKRGRTVLFVSHNMAAVRKLCGRALLLDGGRLRVDGLPGDVTEEYLRRGALADRYEQIPALLRKAPPDPAFRFQAIEIRQRGTAGNTVVNGEPVDIEFRYDVFEPTRGLRVYFDLCDEDGVVLIRSFHDERAASVPVVQPGRYVSTARIPAHLLAPRRYQLWFRGTVHNVRSCSGPGISVPLFVTNSTDVNRAYPGEPLRSRLLPEVTWATARVDRKEEGARAPVSRP